MRQFYKIFRSIYSNCKKLASDVVHLNERLLAPQTPRSDDVYLVSFPKSGATWMDFLVANVNVAMSGSNLSLTFYNCHQYVPDIHDSRDLGDPLLPFPGYRFIKSHSELNRFYNHVIYIVRNPADVMLSYYNFLKGLGAFEGPITKLIESNEFGIRAWVRHVDSWIYKSPASLAFMLVRYEDLISNPKSELDKIYRQMGHVLPQEVIDLSVELSSFKNMKKLEETLNYGGRPVGDSLKFMRSGQIGEGDAGLSENDKATILRAAGHLMERLGYL